MPYYPDAVAAIEWLKAVVTSVRRIRAQWRIPPDQPVPVWLQGGDPQHVAWLGQLHREILSVGRFQSIDWLDVNAPTSSFMGTAVVGTLTIKVPLTDVVNASEEISRTQKELYKHQIEGQRLSAKLDNPRFIQRAPAAVVAKERDRWIETQRMIAQLEDQIQILTIQDAGSGLLSPAPHPDPASPPAG